MFLTDGSSHHGGVSNEHFVIDYLNSHPECELSKVLGGKLVHKGGTQNKADAYVDENGMTVSIKNHKGTGTFDWINTSTDIPNIKNIKKCLDVIKNEIKDVEEARNHVSMVLSTTLFDDQFVEFIRSKLKSACEKNCDYIIINDAKNKRLVGFPNTSIEHMFHEVDITPASSPNQTSAKINKYDIRVRFVLNNGVGALMKNKSSVPCLKFQQDRVDGFIDSITDSKVLVSYE